MSATTPAPVVRPLLLSLWIVVPVVVVVSLAIGGLRWPALHEPLNWVAFALLFGGQAGLMVHLGMAFSAAEAREQQLRDTGRRVRARIVSREHTGTRVNRAHRMRLGFAVPTPEGPALSLACETFIKVENLHRYDIGSEHLVCVSPSGEALALAQPAA